MSVYSEFATFANELLTQFGRQVLLVRGTSTFDPALSKTTYSATATQTLTVVNLPITAKVSKDLFGDNDSDGDLARAEKRYLIAAAVNLTIVPEQLDTLTFDGSTWLIKSITPVNPAGTAVIYKLGCIRGGMDIDEILAQIALYEASGAVFHELVNVTLPTDLGS